MQKNPRLSAIIDQLLQRPTPPVSVHVVVGELIPFSDRQIFAQWQDSPLMHVELTIRRTPAEQQCMVCFQKYRPAQQEVACPHCGARGAKVISGEEFFLESTEEK